MGVWRVFHTRHTPKSGLYLAKSQRPKIILHTPITHRWIISYEISRLRAVSLYFRENHPITCTYQQSLNKADLTQSRQVGKKIEKNQRCSSASLREIFSGYLGPLQIFQKLIRIWVRPLAIDHRLHTFDKKLLYIKTKKDRFLCPFQRSRRDSNARPLSPQPSALSTELREHMRQNSTPRCKK